MCHPRIKMDLETAHPLLRYRMNNNKDPGTEPWGTPRLTFNICDLTLLICTYWVLPSRQLVGQVFFFTISHVRLHHMLFVFTSRNSPVAFPFVSLAVVLSCTNVMRANKVAALVLNPHLWSLIISLIIIFSFFFFNPAEMWNLLGSDTYSKEFF